MSYSKTVWSNGSTPINETNLNKIENQLENLSNITSSSVSFSNKITDFDYNDVKKSGNVVTVYLRFYVNQTVNNQEDWMTLPFSIINEFAFPLFIGRYELTGMKFEYPAFNKTVKGNSLEVGWYQCNFTYLTND